MNMTNVLQAAYYSTYARYRYGGMSLAHVSSAVSTQAPPRPGSGHLRSAHPVYAIRAWLRPISLEIITF
jgi:hypothetical protein